MKKNFIRININDNYLSFGNFFRILKEESNNSASFWQADLFSIIFNTDSIADSTVNNYCTGFRAINSTYKNYIKSLKVDYQKNSSTLLPIFSEKILLLSLIQMKKCVMFVHDYILFVKMTQILPLIFLIDCIQI